MPVTFIQTSDSMFYHSMLLETSKTVKEFCRRNGLAYEQYVGTKRGHMPWHAAFNRIYMLKDLVDRGVEGWVFYLDADAYIYDLDFDLRRYLEDREGFAGIFAGYINEEMYDINSGGFAVNLSHPAGKGLVADYYRAVQNIDASIFDRAIDWERDITNDQHLLYEILKRYCTEQSCGNSFLFERTNDSYVNNGPFISQQLRTMHATFEDRLTAIRARVAEILDGGSAAGTLSEPGIYMSHRHPRIITGCGVKTAFGICSTGTAGGLTFGPYIHLEPGNYVARFHGRARLHGQSSITLKTDVVVDEGRTRLARNPNVVNAEHAGIIAECPFSLSKAVDGLEVRLFVEQGLDVCVHATQIVRA